MRFHLTHSPPTSAQTKCRVLCLGSLAWLAGAFPALATDPPALGKAPGGQQDGQIEVQVELSPSIFDGAIERCVVFTFYEDCASEPIECPVAVAFGGQLPAGVGAATILVDEACPVDIDRVVAAAAIDPLHTLRSVGLIDRVDDTLLVDFTGDPAFGGHWLVGGNLDAWDPNAIAEDAETINMIDFALYVRQHLWQYLDGDTSCSTPGPHADINGDGIVDAGDLDFIMENFTAQSETVSCDPLRGNPEPRTEVSVAELRERGLEELGVADVNGDGWIDYDDMVAFVHGARLPHPRGLPASDRPRSN